MLHNNCEEQLRTPRSDKKEWEQRFSCSPWRRPWLSKLSPVQSMLDHGRSNTPHPVEDSMLEQVIVPPWALQGLQLYSGYRFSGRNCSLWRTPAGAIHSWRTARYSCWSSSRNCSVWEGTMLEQGNSSRRKEQQWLIWTEHNPHSLSPCTIWSGGGWRVRIEIEPGKKGYIFSFVFISHYCNLLLIENY